jgi:hypothetical protein
MRDEANKPPSPRAPRYPLHITMRYRPSGDLRWREARTENISRSGVLFRTDQPLPVEAPIEMVLALPVEVSGAENPVVICRGRVVRTEPPKARDEGPAVAATITGYRLTHSGESDPRRI